MEYSRYAERFRWTWVHNSITCRHLYIVFGSRTGTDMVELGRFYNARIANLYAKQRRSSRITTDRTPAQVGKCPRQSQDESSPSTPPCNPPTPDTATV